MSTAEVDPAVEVLPDHTQLPESDGRIVENFLEHPQGMLLRETLLPVLERRHPDGRYALGLDSGIYWKPTDPPLRGVTAPDWFYVPDVPPTLDGRYRRSYVLWKELVAPLIVLEFASGNGKEERDRTPEVGKFWIYEKVIRPGYYGIFHVYPGAIEMYQMVAGRLLPMAADARGHYPIEDLDVALGVWHGRVENLEFPWMRWFDRDGQMLPSGRELAGIERLRAETENFRAEAERVRAEAEHVRAEAEHVRAEAERERADRLAEQLRALGIEPDA